MKWVGILLALVMAAVVIFKANFPTYSYRYRLQVSLAVDEKVYTGSSVIEVVWECGPKIAGLGQCGARLRGQAAVIDLGARGAVVATLINGEGYGPARDGATNAIWLCANAFGNPSTNADLPKLQKLRGRRDLVPPGLPRLIWFANPGDPTTATKLLAQDIPTTFGPSARFAGAFVEITNDPIVIDIRQRFAWLKPLEDKRPPNNITYPSSGLGISRYLFIGDAS